MTEVKRILVVIGDQKLLGDLRELALEYELSAYWVREKKITRSRQYHQKAVRHPINETRLGRLILSIMRTKPMKEWTIEEIGIEIEAHEYNSNSASPVLSKLLPIGYVNRVDQKVYKLTALGRGDIEARA